jgi:hypothetical protein
MNAELAPPFDLDQLIGEWEGAARTYFEPDNVADESRWRGSIRAVVPGRFLLHEYRSIPPTGSVIGALQGAMLFGDERDAGLHVCAWNDSFHMSKSTMISRGPRAPRGFSVLGSYAAPPGPDWGWRTSFDLITPDRLVILMTNISPEGEESRAVEIEYARV